MAGGSGQAVPLRAPQRRGATVTNRVGTDMAQRRETYYRLRGDAWQTRAIQLGIRPSVRAVADAADIPKTTLYRVVKGEPANHDTITKLLDTLRLPFELLFEHVDGDAD